MSDQIAIERSLVLVCGILRDDRSGVAETLTEAGFEVDFAGNIDLTNETAWRSLIERIGNHLQAIVLHVVIPSQNWLTPMDAVPSDDWFEAVMGPIWHAGAVGGAALQALGGGSLLLLMNEQESGEAWANIWRAGIESLSACFGVAYPVPRPVRVNCLTISGGFSERDLALVRFLISDAASYVTATSMRPTRAN